MKIYFAGAIRGGRDDAKLYKEIISYLGNRGQVLTEHVGYQDIDSEGEKGGIDTNIYNRDMKWLKSADIIIAEVTTPSLGVGYELGIAEKLKKPILCLYRSSEDKKISAMVKGNKIFTCRDYNNIIELKLHVNDFLNQID